MNILVKNVENSRCSKFPGGWEDLLEKKLAYTNPENLEKKEPIIYWTIKCPFNNYIQL